jgi:hypothetical protein
MKCLNTSCNSSNLLAHVQASIAIPLAQKGGSIKLSGVVIKQTDVKEWWDGKDESPTMIRGPIICADCCEEHVYLKGLKPALRKMTYAEAVQTGYDQLAASSEKGDDTEE